MQVEYLGSPCKTFAFRCGEYIPADPKDGHEKYVMGTSGAHTKNVHIFFFDPDTLEAEDIETPGDIGIWALLYLPEYERLLVGTSGYYGWLHCLDMKTRTWMKSLRLDGQTYIWNLVRGSDGLVYGSNYPGCILYCYDPATHTLTSAGRVGSNPENMYARQVYTLPDGNLLISVGFHENGTFLFDIKTRQFRQVFSPGEFTDLVADGIIQTNRDGKIYVYDAQTFALLEGPLDQFSLESVKHPKTVNHLKNKLDNKYAHLLPYPSECHMKKLKDGRIVGYFKQQMFLIKDNQITFHELKAAPPDMLIHALSVADDGIVWFGSGFAQTMGWYNPKTEEYWNSYSSTRINGEIYGVVPYNGQLYFTAYCGGDHIVYDPGKPWNQFENVNPKTLRSVEPLKMGRPIAGSIIGPDGNIWTGWSGTYGIYGGGISRLDVQTNEVTGWFGVVEGQSIRYMAAGRKYLYATSHWMNSGLPYRFNEKFKLLKLDTECNILWEKQFKLGQFPECLLALGGKLYMSMRDRLDGMAKILIYDEETMELVAEKVMNPLGGPGKYEMEKKSIRSLLPYGGDKLVVFIDDEAYLLDAITMEVLQTAQLPEMAEAYAISKDRIVYFSSDEKLYRISFQ